jgi:hypothetical protein
MSLRGMFEMLNRINGTPSKSETKLDAKVLHKESIDVILRRDN